MKVGKYGINLEQHGSSPPRESPISNTTLEVIIANFTATYAITYTNCACSDNRLVNIDYLIINPTCITDMENARYS